MILKKYTISLDGLLGHENIIFKLICSVSERTKSRTISYSLTSGNQNPADIYINDIKNKKDQDATASTHINVWVSDQKENSGKRLIS